MKFMLSVRPYPFFLVLFSLSSTSVFADLKTLSEDELLNVKVDAVQVEEESPSSPSTNEATLAGEALHEVDNLNLRINAANAVILNEQRSEAAISRLLTPIGIREDIRNLVDIAPPPNAQ